MRIALATETFLPSIDGVVARLMQAVKYFRAEGHEVMIIAPKLGVDEYKGAQIKGVRPWRLPFYHFRAWAPPTVYTRVLLRDFQPDIVHAANPILLASSAVHYARSLGIPLLASYHTHIPNYLEHYNMKWAQPAVWRYIKRQHHFAQVNLVTSRAMYGELSKHSFPNLAVLRPGVDVKNRHPRFRSDETRAWLTQGHPERKLLVFIGRLAAEKEIEKIRPLLDARDDIALAIIGDGPRKDSLVKTFEGTNTLFTGFVHGEDLSKAYASADAFIFPSVSETLGLVIREGMASGLPVIAAASAPSKEQIRHRDNGLLYEPDSIGSMIEAVDMLDDTEFIQGLCRRAWEDAQQYSWENASAELLDYYEQAIEVFHERGMGPKRTAEIESDFLKAVHLAPREQTRARYGGRGRLGADPANRLVDDGADD